MKIKFLTLNIWHGGKLLSNVIEFIKKENPDIFILQEVYPETLKKLEKDFPNYNHRFAASLLELKEKTERGNALFSRYPILKTENIFFDIPYGEISEEPEPGDYTQTPRNMQYALVENEDQQLNIYNIHGIWGFDGWDSERRLNMSKIIVDHIKDQSNVILGGDFNLRPETKTIVNIEKYLKNIFKNELKTTFNMKHKTDERYAEAVVDMIFVSPNIKVVEHYCPQVDVSDHLPLVAILEI